MLRDALDVADRCRGVVRRRLRRERVVWGTATEDELQPIIDGWALDELALGGLLVGVPVVLVTWFVTRHRRGQPQTAS